MNENDLKRFTEILKRFDTAMLVTRCDSELRSRPMQIADTTEDGRVWFVTNIDSGKLGEVTDNPGVNVALQADSRFLSISGTVRATRDRAKVDELWKGLLRPTASGFPRPATIRRWCCLKSCRRMSSTGTAPGSRR